MLKIPKFYVAIGVCIVFSSFCNGCSTKSDDANSSGTAKPADSDNIITMDYTNIDAVLADILETLPDIQAEITEIRNTFNPENKSFRKNNNPIEDVPLENLFSVKKQLFRLEVANRLSDQKSKQPSKTEAKKMTSHYIDSLLLAKVFGIHVTQEEVTKYIAEHIAPVVTKEKTAYAKALGLTTEELDYAFDRDLYVIDVVWEKLGSKLDENYPKQNGETDENYMKRIKKEIYSQQ